MRKTALYSTRRPAAKVAAEAPRAPEKPASPVWPKLYARHGKLLTFAAGALFAAALVLGHAALTPPAQALTQQDIDAAVARTLEAKPLPSPAVKAWQAVRGSLVRVRAIGDGLEYDEYMQVASGSGVVIISQGVILTSLHVIAGASRVRVQFSDGLESEATIVSTQPENDLAVLKAAEVPDDLKAATLGSARHLMEGDHVTAVGFPFGIGPSISAGVVSGLRRQYQNFTDLIQFDAAANPGSSGGPLVNARGEVVGVVTSIVSPAESGAFAGIAFAVPIQSAARAAGLPPF